MLNIVRFITLVSIFFIVLLPVTTAQDLDQLDEPPAVGRVPMTLDRIDELVRRIDADAIRNGSSWQINYRGLPIYAIAQGAVWSAFIHPLSALDEREFFSGMGQTMSLVVTYGSTFSSGALTFSGGDYFGDDDNPDEPDVFGDIMEKGEQI